jgi:hypothetical protein
MFGHHRAGETFASDVAAFVHQVPVPIWVATIGVLAAVATPLVQYLVARSREKTVARADERRRTEDLAQTTTRVRADLLFRLRAHLVFLGALAETGTVDVDRWQQAFERFAARTREADVIEALGVDRLDDVVIRARRDRGRAVGSPRGARVRRRLRANRERSRRLRTRARAPQRECRSTRARIGPRSPLGEGLDRATLVQPESCPAVASS